MKLFDASIIIIATIVAAATLVGLVSTCFFKDDSIIEEVAEEVIEKETGLKIDLTPSSKELP